MSIFDNIASNLSTSLEKELEAQAHKSPEERQADLDKMAQLKVENKQKLSAVHLKEDLAKAHHDLKKVDEDLKKVETDLQSTKDAYIRAMADLDNQKKRAKKEIEQAKEQAVEKTVKCLLPVFDSIARAEESKEGDLETLVAGIQIIMSQFGSALKKMGIEKVESVGQKFDPTTMEAISTQQDSGTAAGFVVRELEIGYTLAGRVVRPARVVVAA